MNNAQRVLLATYPIFTGLILLSEYYSEPDFVAYLKVAVMLALTISVVWLAKACDEQKVMALAFIFMALGDFFFVIPLTREDLLIPYGIASFLVAYVCLIVAFQKNVSFGLAEILIALPIMAVFLYIAAILQPYLPLPLFIGTLLFAAVLCYMTWTAICTLPRRFFGTKTAWFVALSACLILASDIRLAYEVFFLPAAQQPADDRGQGLRTGTFRSRLSTLGGGSSRGPAAQGIRNRPMGEGLDRYKSALDNHAQPGGHRKWQPTSSSEVYIG